MIRPVLAAALLFAATPGAAQVVSEKVDRAAVTIYRDRHVSAEDWEDPETAFRAGLSMVTETRTVDLPAGASRVSFRGVSDTMVPQSAAVEGLPGALIERNQDYNMLTPGSLLEASLGKAVRLVRTNRATGKVSVTPAVVRTGPYGPVLETADGKAEAFQCSGAPERLVFDDVPKDLADKPTFSVLADVPKAGRYKVKLSYLATGFDWRADYVARIAADGRTLDLLGWLTLANHSSATFAHAPTDVVAGELSRDDETVPPQVEAVPWQASCWPMGLRRRIAPPPPPPPPAPTGFAYYSAVVGADGMEEIVVTAERIAKQSDLGDYKLYSLPDPTTVAAHQTKQVVFLDQKHVAFERIYSLKLDDRYEHLERPAVLVRLKNEAARGLGKPLPAGVVSVMEPGARGGLVLAGEHELEDTPVGLPVELEIGRAMDVSVTAEEVDFDRTGDTRRSVILVEVANDKDVPIVFELRQARLGENFRVTRATHRTGTKDGEPIWTFRMAPGARATLRYTITYEN